MPLPPNAGYALARDLTSQDVRSLMDVVQKLSFARTLEDVVAVVRTMARALIGADGITFVLKEQDECYYLEEDAVGPLRKGQRFRLQDCIPGYAMVCREQVVVPDVAADTRVPADAYRTTFVKSLAMTPVRREDPLAAIGAYWANQHVPTGRELSLLQALADSVATALANAHLYRELQVSAEREAHAAVEVRSVEERLRLAMSSAAMGAWHYELSTQALVFDERCKEIFGISGVAQPTYETLLFRIHTDDRPRVVERTLRSLRPSSEQILKLEFRILSENHDEERWVSVLGRAHQAGATQQLTGMLWDFTEVKRAQKVLEESIQARDEFLSVAGHELRTPLTALLLQLQGLNSPKDVVPTSSQWKRHLEQLGKAEDQAKKLGRLINELLDVSRITASQLTLEPESVNLTALVNDVILRNSAAAARAKCALECQMDETVVGLWDRSRLEQVVENLLGNALKYGPGNPVHIGVGRRENYAVLTVADRGIGFDTRVKERIFQRFERAVSERHYGGLGLGLWIVRKIVEASKGHIEVESAPGQGATFRILMPLPPADG